MQHKYTNALINESSPYLLQHAHNPVNWLAWNKETLNKAKQENKLILISIGYSACHWCHVMEKESFEDEKVAQLMNDYFVCIKIDREERPDIDQIYMLAVQLMTGHGGWPLNCFALPDGRPIYGGTYFQKQQWVNVLLNLSDLYKNEPEKVLDYAQQLTEGIKLSEIIKNDTEESSITINFLHECFKNWKNRFDTAYGGPNKAPKFPLPNNYQFLLNYARSTNSTEAFTHLEFTLKKIAYGGIYDQIGGGFSRYSVDAYWKVPHFEKMLYDNAQLVSLYSFAYQTTKNNLYKQIVYETLAFIKRELTADHGGFYAALDADSEGEEGKYYVWTKTELQDLIKDDFDLFCDYFNVNENGYWEHNNYILLRNDDDELITKKHTITLTELQKKVTKWKNNLLLQREKRIKPGLDNKVIVSWNALMAKAYLDAYNVFNEIEFLDAAIKNIELILQESQDENVLHHLIGSKKINAFLEDYCFFIEALIATYQNTFNESYLLKAKELVEYCILHFQDKTSGMFYFTSDENNELIARKMELSDNVIPASNSSIAKSLFILGHYFEEENYISLSKKMLNTVTDELKNYPEGYSNWAILALWLAQPFFEVAIVGKSVNEKQQELKKHYLSNVIFAGTTIEKTNIPLLNNRFKQDKTLIYVCVNKTCKEPVETAEEALNQIIN
jgi:uncharacterized protein YyaL (SSP411 family)